MPAFCHIMKVDIKMSDVPQVRPPSSSSKFTVEEYQDGAGDWRTRIISQRMKLDEKAKGRFLKEYKDHARMGDAAAAASVTGGTIRRHMKDDQDFAEACLEAEETYVSRLIEHQQKLVFDGSVKKTYDRQGNLISEETVYPIRLIELELKKHDPGYRDKREVSMNVSGGVLVAPAEMKTIDDWEKQFGGKAIEGEATEVKP